MLPFVTLSLFISLSSLISALPQTRLNLRADSGCGKTQILPGVTQYRFGLKSSGTDRSYSYHLPSDYDKDKQYPVVLGFHGSSSIGAFFEIDTKMSDAKYSANVRHILDPSQWDSD